MRHWYSSIHVEQLASSMRERGHTVSVAANRWELADRPPGTQLLQPQPPAGSKRLRLLHETTHTLSETDSHFHFESCHATVSQDRLNTWRDTRRLHRCRTQRNEPRAHPHLPGRQTHVALHSMRTRFAPSRAQARRLVPSHAHQGGQAQPVRNPERVGVGPHGAPPARAICLS